jgi:photosystem II stability/assembly factor-like uncharacterized protein
MNVKIMRNKVLLGLIILVLSAAASHAAGSWVSRPSISSESVLNDVHFTSATNGWAVGDNGLIMRSTNRGATWTTEASGTTQNLSAVHFFDADNGWAVGTALTLVKHTAAGWTVATMPAPANLDLAGVYMTSASNIWVAAPGFTTFGPPSKYRNFFHSHDGGVSWEGMNIQNSGESTSTPPVLNYLYSVYFRDDNNGWVVGTNKTAGKIFRTTDGAVTWQDVSPSPAATGVDFHDVYFTSATNGWVVGGTGGTSPVGYIYNTTDGGATWTRQTTPSTPALYMQISGPDAGNLWTCGGGSLFNYDGTNWLTNATPSGAGSFKSIYFSDPWNGWAVGGLLTSEAGGPKRSIYKYIIEPSNLQTYSPIFFTPSGASYEAKTAFSGNNIQSNSTVTIDATAGLTGFTYEVVYDPLYRKNKFDVRVWVDPATAVSGLYTFYVANLDEGTSGTGSFTVRESVKPTDKPAATALPGGIFTGDKLKFQVVTSGEVTASGMRTSSVPAGVFLDLYVYQTGSRQIVYHRRFETADNGITTFDLDKVNDMGLEISNGIYRAEVIHPTYGVIASGQIVVNHK